MPHYIAPTKDMQYVLNDALDIKNTSIPGYAAFAADFLSAILGEAGNITSQVLAHPNSHTAKVGVHF